MKSEKKILSVLDGNVDFPPPFWMMRQAGRYLPEYRKLRATSPDFLKFCFTPELATEVTLQPIRRFGMDAAIIFSDILVIPYALGIEVSFQPGEGPVLTAIRDHKAIPVFQREILRKILMPVTHALKAVKNQLSGTTALIGFCGAPWTVACYMVEGGSSRDFTQTREWAYRKPEEFSLLIDVIVDASVEYLDMQIEAGAEVIQLFDSWAGVLPPEEFSQWVIAPTRKIVQALRSRHPHIPIMGFPKGAGILYKDYAQQTEIDAVSIDMYVPLAWAKKNLSPHVTVQGNLDPTLLAADEKKAVAETKKIIAMFQETPFIFNLGHGILPHTPVEHVAAVCETLHNIR